MNTPPPLEPQPQIGIVCAQMPPKGLIAHKRVGGVTYLAVMLALLFVIEIAEFIVIEQQIHLLVVKR